MDALRVLLTNLLMSGRSGTESVTRDIALGLRRRGHLPVVYAQELGPVADELRSASIPVVDEIDTIRVKPDVIHGQHNAPLAAAVARFPDVPAIFVCHDFAAWPEEPPHFPSICRYVAVDEAVADRLSIESGIAPERVVLHLNAVDLERFVAPPDRLPYRPSRALAYVKHTAHLAEIGTACAARGIALDVAGTVVGARVDAPEEVFARYDLVFTSALSALEAMACGCAVIVCDARGLAGIVTPESFERWRPLNFGRRSLTRRVTAGALVNEIDGYDPRVAAEVTAIVRRTAGMAQLVDQYIALYRSCIDDGGSRGDSDSHARALARHIERWRPRYGPSWPWMIERRRLVNDLDAALDRPPRLGLGEKIALSSGHSPIVEYVAGFSYAEDWGVWTDAERAMLTLRTDVPGEFVDVALLVHAFVMPDHTLEVDVRANGVSGPTWSFEHPRRAQWHTVRAPIASSGVLVLDFVIRTPRSPRDLGASDDGRRLGLGIQQIELRAPRDD